MNETRSPPSIFCFVRRLRQRLSTTLEAVPAARLWFEHAINATQGTLGTARARLQADHRTEKQDACIDGLLSHGALRPQQGGHLVVTSFVQIATGPSCLTEIHRAPATMGKSRTPETLNATPTCSLKTMSASGCWGA